MHEGKQQYLYPMWHCLRTCGRLVCEVVLRQSKRGQAGVAAAAAASDRGDPEVHQSGRTSFLFHFVMGYSSKTHRHSGPTWDLSTNKHLLSAEYRSTVLPRSDEPIRPHPYESNPCISGMFKWIPLLCDYSKTYTHNPSFDWLIDDTTCYVTAGIFSAKKIMLNCFEPFGTGWSDNIRGVA